MTFYVRFIFSLAVGLCGLGLVMTIVLDELFGDWNVGVAIHDWLSEFFARQSDIHRRHGADLRREIEKARTTAHNARLLQQRRERLRDLASVESRLVAPRGVVVTPLPTLNRP